MWWPFRPRQDRSRTEGAHWLPLGGEWAWYGRSASGIEVTPRTAEALDAVVACVRVLSETLGQVPLLLYRRREDGGRDRATDHPLFGVLHDAPNPLMDAFTFRETAMGHLLLRGNFLSEIERNVDGRVRALWPLHPDRVEPRLDGSTVTYLVTLSSGEKRTLRRQDVFHLRMRSESGLWGRSIVATGAETIGSALAAERFAARFFANDATPGGILQTDKQLSAEAFGRVKTSWEQAHQGLDNAHRVAILEEGLDWKSIGISAEDAQLLESRRYGVEAVARLFRVPPHLVGALERSTFNNIAEQSREFLTLNMGAHFARWEAAVGAQLLGPRERLTFFAEHLAEGLLRGDTRERFRAYAVARQWGWMSVNEIRRRENLDPIEGGDRFLEPVNMADAAALDDDDDARPRLAAVDAGGA